MRLGADLGIDLHARDVDNIIGKLGELPHQRKQRRRLALQAVVLVDIASRARWAAGSFDRDMAGCLLGGPNAEQQTVNRERNGSVVPLEDVMGSRAETADTGAEFAAAADTVSGA
jgi:hypothetical protein